VGILSAESTQTALPVASGLRIAPAAAIEWACEVIMAQMTPQVSELLEKVLALSTQERGLLIDHLIESLDEGPRKKELKRPGPTRSKAGWIIFGPARSK
jgi:hypothetical protein